MAEVGNNTATTPTGKRKHPAHWDKLLTERSILFYDGTYKWNGTDGFWDGKANLSSGGCVCQHQFITSSTTPNDPEAYPPAPRPVGLWLEEDDETEMAEDGLDDVSPLDDDNHDDTSTSDPAPELTSPDPTALSEDLHTKFIQDDEQTLVINGTSYKKTTRRDNLFPGHPEHDRLLGQIEGILIGKHILEKNVGLEEGYKLCGAKVPSTLLDAVDGRAAAADEKIIGLERQCGEVVGEGEHVEDDIRDVLPVMKDVKSKDPAMLAKFGGEKAEEKTPKSPVVAGDAASKIRTVAARHVDRKMDGEDNDGMAKVGAKEADVAEGTPLESSPLSDCPSDLCDWHVEDQATDADHAHTQKSVSKLKENEPGSESSEVDVQPAHGCEGSGQQR